MEITTTTLLVMLLASSCAAESWKWPGAGAGAGAGAATGAGGGGSSVRIDTKVHFIDAAPSEAAHKKFPEKSVESDEPQFSEPTNTAGFYNRPPGVGRYPVHVERHRAPYKVDPSAVYNLRKSPPQYSDGTLDSMQYCKCVSTPECSHNVDSEKACGVGKYLCCYKRSNKSPQHHTESFNEIEDERPLLLPGEERAGPFPPPPGISLNTGHEAAVLGAVIGPANTRATLFGPGGPNGIFGPAPDRSGFIHPTGVYSPEQPNQGVLVGPDGPTGVIGLEKPIAYRGPNRGVLTGPGFPNGVSGHNKLSPFDSTHQGVLVGPGGPTGVIGPNGPNDANGNNKGVLTGPGGPTGVTGPSGFEDASQGVLTGPGGPTGSIGPDPNQQDFYLPSFEAQKAESAQRGILVGPGGPTGIIGPIGYGRRPVLIGPGGPTGVIGPYGSRARPILTGPGGPTGMIGPPRRYYGK